MFKVSLIGPGDIEYHYYSLLNIQDKQLREHIHHLSRVLAETCEIVLLPDSGICFEIAKKYKEFGGEKCSGIAPLDDKIFGIKHLKEYMRAKISGDKKIKVFDEIINTGNWYKQHFAHCLFGDIILMLGTSPGTLYEMASAFYVYKIFQGYKDKVNVMEKQVHKQIVAGTKIPFTLIIYKPFMKSDIQVEMKEYISRIGGKIYYAKNPRQLLKIMITLTTV
jgi:hypothetical protein